MKLDPKLLRETAGEVETAAGKELFRTGHVRLLEETQTRIRYAVSEMQRHEVTVTDRMTIHCDCEVFASRFSCRHAIAAWMFACDTDMPERLLRRRALSVSSAVNALTVNTMPSGGDVQLEVTVAIPARTGQNLRIGLRIGAERMYVIRSIPRFIFALENGENIEFGKKFTFNPEWMRFSEKDRHVLERIRSYITAQSYGEGIPETDGTRMIQIPDTCAHELFDALRQTPFRLMDPTGHVTRVNEIRETRLPMHFRMFLTPTGISASSVIPGEIRPLTKDMAYVLIGNEPAAVPEDQKDLLRVLWENGYDGHCLTDWPLRETADVVCSVMPYLKLRGTVEVSPELNMRLIRKPLEARVYLDKERAAISGRVVFAYGDTEIDPFAPAAEKISLGKGEKLLLRDAEAEHVILDRLADDGFRMYHGTIRLENNDEIWRFVTEGIFELKQCCEVMLSEDFRRIAPRRPTLAGSLKLAGTGLELAMTLDDEPTDEMLAILNAIRRHRKYYRLKDGAFLDLSGMEGVEELAGALCEAAVRDGNEPDRDRITLRAYRTCYLNALLEHAGSRLGIERDESVRETVEALSAPEAKPAVLSDGAELRGYQKRGYEWMSTLDRLHMGGVLADDMGLGKTIQVIALLQAAKEEKRTSLIVAPTSLTYNWLSELNRFAPDMTASVLTGNGLQRASLINHVKENSDLDVLITSYPLIRRDIALMADYRFRFVILDEAQHIKNAGSAAAAAVKQLQADTRFALTGTPMENGIGELWSVFDFVLPGYLPAYNTFIKRYQDGENAEDLRARIGPFLTRRLKQDVLEELPDKTEIVLTARMTQEQQAVYNSAMLRLRPRVREIVEQKHGRGHAEILSAITELREICCHPSLVMDGYAGSSGKMELLSDILPEAAASGRRILLFSQFTGMLRILRAALEEEGYSVMYLDGETPADERLRLTETFNEGRTQIFLISLRAGGSGLNLTGADMVIHYDPWWNPAMEDQATDRAYRIGQTKKVDVIRLVTADTVEQKVVELGSRKKALFERLIAPGDAALEALTEQDIIALFR
ncbi:MAG: DEAD/DEAH box helicase [Clostridia bacterium]|nr:DEAD/DEAH box helicase [Clostridia bacterium]